MTVNWKPDYSVTPQRIVCAACQHKDGAIVIGIRHFDGIMFDTIILRREIDPYENWDGCDQGFVDQFGNFLTRRESWIIAVKANQIYRLVGNQTEDSKTREDVELFSENLY